MRRAIRFAMQLGIPDNKLDTVADAVIAQYGEVYPELTANREKIMTELEDKTGLLRRFMQMQDKLQSIADAAEEIQTINYRQYENPRLQTLAQTIVEAAAALRE